MGIIMENQHQVSNRVLKRSTNNNANILNPVQPTIRLSQTRWTRFTQRQRALLAFQRFASTRNTPGAVQKDRMNVRLQTQKEISA